MRKDGACVWQADSFHTRWSGAVIKPRTGLLPEPPPDQRTPLPSSLPRLDAQLRAFCFLDLTGVVLVPSN